MFYDNFQFISQASHANFLKVKGYYKKAFKRTINYRLKSFYCFGRF